jgi:membrane-bound lytic murein transglycosylase D
MRRRWAAVVALGVLAACSPLRPSTPPEALAPDPRADAAPAPEPLPSELSCLQHPRIDVWEDRLRSQRELRHATQKSLERGEQYLPRLREILAANGVPEDLALLPVVESGFRNEARGRYGERGLWQLRRQTARRWGLVVDRQRDDRIHPERSTEAAARYLRHLHARYGEWPLALAAYNAGEHRVDRARAREPDADFWELAEHGRLPRTSRDFVPRFIAVVRVTDGEPLCQRPAGRTTRFASAVSSSAGSIGLTR